MSGDAPPPSPAPVVVLEEAEHTTRLVTALDELTTAEVGFVLVGGLAVMSRLGTVHRATSDLDALSGIEDFEVICAREIGSSELDEGHLYVGGVKVDALYADPAAGFDDIVEHTDESLGRLFNMAHRFALDDASDVVVVSGSSSVRVRVATVRALLITKLHAYLAPTRQDAKRGSDALDVVRLGDLLARADGGTDPGVRLVRSQLPDPVADVAVWALEQVVADPAAIARRLRQIGAPPAPAGLFELLVDDLRGRA